MDRGREVTEGPLSAAGRCQLGIDRVATGVRRRVGSCLLVTIALGVSGCAERSRPSDAARTVENEGLVLAVQEGLATYYGAAFQGKATASGVPFDMHAMMGAHPTYPFGTLVRVTNVGNGRSVEIRIVDRGPAQAPRAAGVIVDLSRAAAAALDFVADGRTPVQLEVLRWGQ